MPNPTVRFETTLGTFEVEVFLDRMPATARNFLKLVRAGFYDGLHFHRIVRGFMVQFGCPHSREPQSPLAGSGEAPWGTIPDEFPPGQRISNEPLTLAMANTGAPDTGSCQFFINTADNTELDWFEPGPSRHPVFGRVKEGAEVIRRIELAGLGTNGRPRTPIEVRSVAVEEVEPEPEPVAAPGPRVVSPPVAAPRAAQPPAPVRRPSAPARRPPAGNDPWSVLGVTRGASAEAIRAAYESRARALEPARLTGLSPQDRRAAEDALQRLNVAWQIIGS